MRLNFEFNLECYHEELGRSLDVLALSRRNESRLLTAEEMKNRSQFQQLRDGTARLLKPYL